jgi:arginase family enzyme
LKKAKIFGAAFDPDERQAKIANKIAYSRQNYSQLRFRDPYDGAMTQLEKLIQKESFEVAGNLPVEPWLVPSPEHKYVSLLEVDNIVAFIDSDGCREYADKTATFVREKVLPDISVLLGVDHSLTGGCLQAFTKEYGVSEVGLIILDSHFDAVTPSVRCGLIQYDIENNPESPFDPLDPYIRGRLDSYNADSFLHYLINEGKVAPENVLVLGVSDYPPEEAFKVDDERVKRYLSHYLGFEEKSVKIIRKEKIRRDPLSVKRALKKLKANHIYLSVDIDIGANAALRGARFLDYEGLNEEEIYRLIKLVKHRVGRGDTLVGFDILETDVYEAGVRRDGSEDRTYHIEANIAKILLT